MGRKPTLPVDIGEYKDEILYTFEAATLRTIAAQAGDGFKWLAKIAKETGASLDEHEQKAVSAIRTGESGTLFAEMTPQEREQGAEADTVALLAVAMDAAQRCMKLDPAHLATARESLARAFKALKLAAESGDEKNQAAG